MERMRDWSFLRTWEIRISELRGQSVGSRTWEFLRAPVEGEIINLIQEAERDVGLALNTPTSTVKDSSSFLHVEKMDSEVANSKYHSLFFILCWPQRQAREGQDKLDSAGRGGFSDRGGHQPPSCCPSGSRGTRSRGFLGVSLPTEARSQTRPKLAPATVCAHTLPSLTCC